MLQSFPFSVKMFKQFPKKVSRFDPLKMIFIEMEIKLFFYMYRALLSKGKWNCFDRVRHYNEMFKLSNITIDPSRAFDILFNLDFKVSKWCPVNLI